MERKLRAKICLDNWSGRRELDCEVVKETKTRYVCRMLSDGLLPRGHVQAGEIVKLPKYAVMIETPDHEREIPRQIKERTVEPTVESELPQGRGESLVAQLDSVRLGKPPTNRNRVGLCGLLRLCTFFSLVRLLIAVVLKGDSLTCASRSRSRQQSMLMPSKSTMSRLTYWPRSESDYEIQAVAVGTRLEK